ncbi:MAG: LPXTG cell wall anchor domain-containing protein, partial [Firmicutes bacterium]|nr:LPXTG cell wall anchor domain-containing protein [Bacillota bacterium]
YGECFVWDINVPVTIDEQVQLTYSVKLTNPKTAAGTYGEYDRDGSQGKAELYTNNSAVLEYTSSNGTTGHEEFNKPTVSYTVAAGQEGVDDPTDAADITDEEAAAEDAVKTGDTLSMMMLIALILAMVGGAVVLITRKRRSI